MQRLQPVPRRIAGSGPATPKASAPAPLQAEHRHRQPGAGHLAGPMSSLREPWPAAGEGRHHRLQRLYHGRGERRPLLWPLPAARSKQSGRAREPFPSPARVAQPCTCIHQHRSASASTGMVVFTHQVSRAIGARGIPPLLRSRSSRGPARLPPGLSAASMTGQAARARPYVPPMSRALGDGHVTRGGPAVKAMAPGQLGTTQPALSTAILTRA
jgi:hypothetical protein